MKPLITGLMLILLGAPAVAWAQEASSPVRVRASHRVDVIAPGERIDTVIDRMRATRSPVVTGEELRPPVRPPEARRAGPTLRPWEGAQGGARRAGIPGREGIQPAPTREGPLPVDRLRR